MQENSNYIFVDLDGTLVRTDVFLEAILRLIKQKPLKLFQLIYWICQGRSVAKAKVAALTSINAEFIPYEPELIEYLREKKTQGKKLVLATASHRVWAEKIASHLGLFDQVIATDFRNNLKGKEKLAAIRGMIGDAEFTYCGDSSADRPIWLSAARNVFVNAPRKDIARAESQNKAERIFVSGNFVPGAFFREMRTHQYAKNALIFVPLFTSHIYQDISAPAGRSSCFSMLQPLRIGRLFSQ